MFHNAFESVLHNSIYDYISTLGWRQINSNQVNTSLLMVPEDFKSFLLNTQEEHCKQIRNRYYDGDDDSFFESIIQSAYEYVYSKYNMAIQITNRSANNRFIFHDEVFNLFYPWENEEDDTNIYSVAKEVSISFINNIGEKETRRTDISLFLNGFIFSNMEIKARGQGQNASENGRNKVVGDICEIVNVGLIGCNIDIHTQNAHLITKGYTSPVYYLTMDDSTCYVLRSVSELIEPVSNLIKKNREYDAKKLILKKFYKDVIGDKNSYTNLSLYRQDVLNTYFSKDAVQKEILYNNSLKRVEGQKYELIVPRPNQLYGINACLKRIASEIDYDTRGENYDQFLLKEKLMAHDFSKTDIDNILNERLQFKNNTSIISLLMQYAAGFGKTYLMCWIALNLRNIDSINKILLISDRIDLRDQMARELGYMNINERTYARVTNQEELTKALNDVAIRIIVVNIHKFGGQNNDDIRIFHDIINRYHGLRYAFLIDEIHRSNGADGVMHTNMLETFNNLSGNTRRRNILIGFTATPNEDTNLRFGEGVISPGHNGIVHWKPFDSYTMRQAIEDGFVLDVSQSIVYKGNVMRFKGTHDSVMSNAEIYENEDRINDNVKTIVNKLIHTTFSKIKGHGKGMLVCYSIDAAIMYYHKISKALSEHYKNTFGDRYDELYENNKVPRAYIVFSQRQGVTNPLLLNNQYNHPSFVAEEDVINNFKNIRHGTGHLGCKNGLMIVVDKLQTGFDVPTLHTLFVDKELHGISAIQTLCRVNRTKKDKYDCLVIDMSHDSRNRKNFRNAFQTYENMVIVPSPSISEIHDTISMLYNSIINHEILRDYRNICNNESISSTEKKDEFILLIQNMIKEGRKETCKKLLNDIAVFKRNIDMYRDVFKIDEKYLNPVFYKEMKKIANIINMEISDETGERMYVSCEFEEGGFIDESQLKIGLGGESGNSPGNNGGNTRGTGYSVIDKVIDKIARANAQGDELLRLIEQYQEYFEVICYNINEYIKYTNKNKSLMNILNQKCQTENVNIDEDTNVKFMSVLEIIWRRLQDPNIRQFYKKHIMNDDSVVYDYIQWLKNNQ